MNLIKPRFAVKSYASPKKCMGIFSLIIGVSNKKKRNKENDYRYIEKLIW